MSDVLDDISKKARDHSRTPMQWDGSSNAGFTTGTPWMRVNDDYADPWNVEAQLRDEGSVRSFWKQALAVRKEHEVLVYGDFRIISFENDQVFAYIRTLGNATALVLLNFKETEVVFPLDEVKDFNGFKLVLGNYPSEKELPSGSAGLKGYEGKVYIN